jgi:hypothetical protein
MWDLNLRACRYVRPHVHLELAIAASTRLDLQLLREVHHCGASGPFHPGKAVRDFPYCCSFHAQHQRACPRLVSRFRYADRKPVQAVYEKVSIQIICRQNVRNSKILKHICPA